MTINLGIWEIAVLALLREAPMHPYQMQRLLRDRHKDEILVLKRGSLYHAIGRLERAGLIESASTSRDGRRPERTTYRLTPVGQEHLISALQKIVATPRRESSEFVAAMSFLIHLAPQEAISYLDERCLRLEKEIEHRGAGMRAASDYVDRINLIESEYLLAMLEGELKWARSIGVEIREGKLTWNIEKIFSQASASAKSAGLAKE